MGNWFYILATLLALYLVGSYARSSWQRLRSLERTAKSWLSLAGSLAGLAFASFFLLLMGSTAWNMTVGSARLSALEGQAAPELRFASVPDAAPGSLEEHRGRVVLVNFWATWCAPCIKEMPALESLQVTYRDRGLVVLHISDEPPDVLADYLARSPMSTVHGRVARFSWPTYARPTSFVVDREGVVRETLVGSRSLKDFEAAVQKWL
jgi:thiol-disulfide isomerase/thioredoxin